MTKEEERGQTISKFAWLYLRMTFHLQVEKVFSWDVPEAEQFFWWGKKDDKWEKDDHSSNNGNNVVRIFLAVQVLSAVNTPVKNILNSVTIWTTIWSSSLYLKRGQIGCQIESNKSASNVKVYPNYNTTKNQTNNLTSFNLKVKWFGLKFNQKWNNYTFYIGYNNLKLIICPIFIWKSPIH